MLSLSIILNKTTVTVGELPEVTVRLINEGAHILLVNSRMLLVPEESADDMKEMILVIEGPPESINLKRVHVNAKAPKPGDFVRLLPGEYLYSIYELEQYFSYEDAGGYRVFAEYYNAWDLIMGGIRSWKGQIRSNVEYFEIIV
jgi:hypothetical protein